MVPGFALWYKVRRILYFCHSSIHRNKPSHGQWKAISFIKNTQFYCHNISVRLFFDNATNANQQEYSQTKSNYHSTWYSNIGKYIRHKKCTRFTQLTISIGMWTRRQESSLKFNAAFQPQQKEQYNRRKDLRNKISCRR